MADWDDVRALATALPDTDERADKQGSRQWRVKNTMFVWERPLRRGDLTALGPDAPDGPVLAARVPDVVAKEALLADPSGVYFTTPHFDGYAIVLVDLEHIARDELEELIVEAWLDRAPKRVAKAWLDAAE